ncbi:MAG: MFS transporter, partial [Lachnospiraceae bacterium]|nr:MFS transporter [Lachnospiraceae bacterium]
IGKFTGYYYASSMAAQTVTPILLGFLFMSSGAWGVLPIYAAILTALSALVFAFFVKNIKAQKIVNYKGIEAFSDDD